MKRIAKMSLLLAIGLMAGCGSDQSGQNTRVVTPHYGPQLRPIFVSMTTIHYNNGEVVHFTNLSSSFH